MKAAPLLLLLLSVPAIADDKTLWLVRPLYPGQEALAGRTEQALDKLTPPILRQFQVIGHNELVTALKGKKVEDLPCFLGETRCADPIDPFVAQLGFDRIVLIQGGQDEAGFKFKVVSYQPALRKTSSASASDVSLDNALLGAVAKVVPVTATLEVGSEPPGATVYVDDRKVGVTPVKAQVLPGERVVRLDLKLHQGIAESVIVPMKGSVLFDRNLQKVAARIIITAQPAGTSIEVDGQVLGKDRVDRGVQPGTHTIRLTADEHKAFEQTVQVKPEDQFYLDKTLEPIAGKPPPPTEKIIIVEKERPPPPAAPPPPPLTVTEELLERRSYFYVGFEYDRFNGGGFLGHRFGDGGNARAYYINNRERQLFGGTFEFGYLGKYFGIAAFGATVEFIERSWQMSVGRPVNKTITNTIDNACPTGEANDLNTCLPETFNANLVLSHFRFIHPMFRVQAWRFMFFLQGGLELRVGWLTDRDTSALQYNDGFLVMDLGVSGRGGLRFYVVDGFFLYANYRFAYFFVSPFDSGGATEAGLTGAEPVWKLSPFSQGFSGGLGYAF